MKTFAHLMKPDEESQLGRDGDMLKPPPDHELGLALYACRRIGSGFVEVMMEEKASEEATGTVAWPSMKNIKAILDERLGSSAPGASKPYVPPRHATCMGCRPPLGRTTRTVWMSRCG